MTEAAAVALPKAWICDLGCALSHGTCDMTKGKTDVLWDLGNLTLIDRDYDRFLDALESS